MIYLKQVADATTLEKLDFDRVIYETQTNNVLIREHNLIPNQSLYWYLENDVLYIRATEKENYSERVLYTDGAEAKNGWWLEETKSAVTKVVFEEEVVPTSCCRFFDGLQSLTKFENFRYLRLEECTNTRTMFQNCNSIQDIDVSKWNVSKVTDSSWMFNICTSLKTIKGLDKWNVSEVTDMTRMFSSCDVLTSVGDLSNWDVSNVTDMKYMFYQNYKLGNIDVSNWDVSNVTDMKYMFSSCNVLTSVGDLSNWDVSNVTDMKYMFCQNYKLGNIDVSNWDVSNVTDMQYMFYKCVSITEIDVSNWDVSKVTDMQYMFRQIGVTEFTFPSSLEYYYGAFVYFCPNLTTVHMSKITGSAWGVFDGCGKLATVTYPGTIEEWKALERTNYWFAHTRDVQIICTDGITTK